MGDEWPVLIEDLGLGSENRAGELKMVGQDLEGVEFVAMRAFEDRVEVHEHDVLSVFDAIILKLYHNRIAK